MLVSWVVIMGMALLPRLSFGLAEVGHSPTIPRGQTERPTWKRLAVASKHQPEGLRSELSRSFVCSHEGARCQMYHTSPRRKLDSFNRDCGGLVAPELAPVPFFDFYP